MFACCLECDLPLPADGLTCTSCGQHHTCILTVERQSDARRAYLASRVLSQHGLSSRPAKDIAAHLQADRGVYKTTSPLSPLVLAELTDLGCLHSEGLEKLPAWQAGILTLRDRYGIGFSIWKPVALLAAIILAQKFTLAIGPSAGVVAKAEQDAALLSPQEHYWQNRKLQNRSYVNWPASMFTPQAQTHAPPKAAAPRVRQAPPPSVSQPQNAHDTRVNRPASRPPAAYYASTSNKDCFFKARRGYEVKIKAYNGCFRCQRRDLVWEGTLSDAQESDELKDKMITSYTVEADGKFQNVDGGCFGMVLVPGFDPELFPVREEDR